MKILRMTGKIISGFRLKNSVNGNPRWRFLLLVNDTVYEFRTKTDSLVGHLIEHRMYCGVVIDYHVTRTGNRICDDITYEEYKGV